MAEQQIVYRAKCSDCKYEWTSRAGYGMPTQCPQCRSKRISTRPL